MTQEGKLLAFMMGWKRAAAGSAFSGSEMSNPDFKAGHEQGRKDKALAYRKASKKYGSELSPLRTQSKSGYICDSDGYTGHTGDINPEKLCA